MNSTTELTTEMVYNDVKGFLSETGEVLKEGATQGFELMVAKIFWVDGVISLILGIVLLIVAYVIYNKIIICYKSDMDEMVLIPIVMFGGVTFLRLLIFGFGHVYEGAIHMAIPEYYAIEQIIGFVK